MLNTIAQNLSNRKDYLLLIRFYMVQKHVTDKNPKRDPCPWCSYLCFNSRIFAWAFSSSASSSAILSLSRLLSWLLISSDFWYIMTISISADRTSSAGSLATAVPTASCHLFLSSSIRSSLVTILFPPACSTQRLAYALPPFLFCRQIPLIWACPGASPIRSTRQTLPHRKPQRISVLIYCGIHRTTCQIRFGHAIKLHIPLQEPLHIRAMVLFFARSQKVYKFSSKPTGGYPPVF